MSRRQMFAFGFNGDGQLGNRSFLDGDEGNRVRSPQVVFGAPTGPNGISVKAIAIGEKHTLFLAEDGKVWSCGSNQYGELGRGGSREGSYTIYPVLLSVGVTIVQIAAGQWHSMAVSDDGRLFAWGSNSAGQLGLPEKIQSIDVPKRVSLTEAVQVACGPENTILIIESGRIFVWGRQPDGRVLHAPKEIEFFVPIPIVQVSAGHEHFLALSASGALFSWGKNDYGQLGTSDNKDYVEPQEIDTSLNVVYVSCGGAHTVALTYEGRVFVCGDDSFGQLGDGKKYPYRNSIHAVTDMLGTHVTQVGCGRCHTMALADGKMYTFGLNSSGQLGTGNTRNQITPRPIDSITNVASIFAGWDQGFCIQAKHVDEILSGPSCFLQTPKFLSLRRVREIFAAGEKLSIIGELESVFSSLASVNGSFLLHGEQRFRCGPSNSCVDMDGLAYSSRMIAESPDSEQYAELIINALDTSALWDASWEKPLPPESLRVFLILPSLYFFASPTYQLVESFHLRFVRALQFLSKKNYSILEKWWSALEPRHFNRLVSSLVSALQTLIENDAKNQSAAMAFLRVLSTLNDINVSLGKIALDKFYVNNLKQKVDIANDYVNWSFSNENTAAFSWSNYPFIMNADVKSMLLHLEARVQMQISMSAGPVAMFPFNMMVLQADPFFTIRVNRDRVVDDALLALLSCKNIDLKKPLKVTFAGEEGDDAGGVKKEFFMLLFQELLQPKYGMFVEYEETHLIWFSGVESDPLSFRLTGMLCALAIYNNVLVDFPFPLALYKKILEKPISLEDLNELSPTEGRSLQSLLDYEESDFEDVFGLTFVMNIALLGESKEVELKPDGANIPVTQINKNEYVKLYVEKKMEEGNDGEIRRQMSSFREGFGSVIHSKIMKFFQPQELMEMVIGNENYDWNEFRKNADYKGVYHPNHEAIRCFWDVFFELNLDQRKQFLQFLMGSTRVPLQGMSALKMTIQPCDPASLPVAHTCFNILDLPNISDREEMRRRLLICLENIHGFTLA